MDSDRSRRGPVLARERLVEMLGDEPDIESWPRAAPASKRSRPFAPRARIWCCWICRCPISMASEIIAELGDAMPLTIFVTAYDEYALKAFEVHAFDYLLKPFGRERFHQAVARARTRLSRGAARNISPGVSSRW